MAGTVTMPTVTDAVASRPLVAPTGSAGNVRVELEVLDEPLELLSEFRAAARDRPAAARASAPALLAAHASLAWETQLDELGMPTTAVTHAFETCRREIWLWVQGDRRWEQLATHLVQRVVRRERRSSP